MYLSENSQFHICIKWQKCMGLVLSWGFSGLRRLGWWGSDPGLSLPLEVGRTWADGGRRRRAAWIETALCHSRQLDTVKDRDNPSSSSSSSGQQLNSRSNGGQFQLTPVWHNPKVLCLDPVSRPVQTAHWKRSIGEESVGSESGYMAKWAVLCRHDREEQEGLGGRERWAFADLFSNRSKGLVWWVPCNAETHFGKMKGRVVQRHKCIRRMVSTNIQTNLKVYNAQL